MICAISSPRQSATMLSTVRAQQYRGIRNARMLGYGLILFVLALESAIANECACGTGNVHIRTGAGTSHPSIGVLTTGECMTFQGHMKTIGGHHWTNIDYHGQDGWVAADWITFRDCVVPTTTAAASPGNSNTSCPKIITRAQWNARTPARAFGHFTKIPHYVFVHHGASPPCFDQSACAAEVRAYQNYHMDTHGLADIGYSFVIGEDGNVYEANGWDIVGAHTYGYNGVGIGICIIGDFRQRVPNAKAMTALTNLIQCGVDLQKLPRNYTVQGHCDVVATSCPGSKLMEVIQTWTHYHRPSGSHCAAPITMAT